MLDMPDKSTFEENLDPQTEDDLVDKMMDLNISLDEFDDLGSKSIYDLFQETKTKSIRLFERMTMEDGEVVKTELVCVDTYTY